MPSAQHSVLERTAFFLAFGSVASILFSIAVSNILLALALASLLISGAKFRFPPVAWPLALFFTGTLISMAASENPSAGRPQIRKFFVFLTLLLVASTFQKLAEVRALFLVCTMFGTLSALRALAQFAWMLRNCGDQYGCMVGERITGFMSHWMTFGGHMMIVLMLLASFLFWGEGQRRLTWVWVGCGALMGVALIANGTRGIWLATAVAASYLLWNWKRWTVLIVPAVVALALIVSPGYIQKRVVSAWQPHGEVDSNEHRRVSWRTGFRMIQAHPLVGVGPEHVKLQFERYVPPDVKKLPEGWYGHLHNIYLHYAAERGIPTLMALLWLLGKVLFDFRKALRGLPPGPGDARFVLQAGIATILAILVGGIFEHNLGDSEVLILTLAIISCGYVAVEAAKNHGARTEGA